jgi:23S rRNA (uracil1939-C5)-methyltransferase
MAEVAIVRLGARGDGLAADGLAVAGALPGETVRVEAEKPGRARLVEVLTPSPERVDPFCPHFGTCGGCAVQHLAPEPYAAWKRGIVAEALARARLDAPLDALSDAHGRGRRRITLHVRAGESGPVAGFMAARSHDLVAIEACPAAEARLAPAAGAARALARALGLAKPLDAVVAATEGGLDLDLRGHGPASDKRRLALTRLADDLDLARLSLHGETLVERRPPRLAMGAGVVPPPGGFLQATEAGEATLAGLVVGAVGKARRVADLFSGCGPFSLRLAARAEVHAVEADAAALAAIDRAARATPGLRRITTERRDLFRRPLLKPELDRFDAVVFDPPRAGAEAQARWLAESKVPVVVGVSCDPGTFARDAATLVGGGYRLERVTPVDQFKWTPHVEMVGVFRRGR